MSKVAKAGGEIRLCRYFDMPGWLIVHTLLQRTVFNSRLVRIHDGIVVPVCRPLERIVTLPFGKNLILVAAKPG